MGERVECLLEVYKTHIEWLLVLACLVREYSEIRDSWLPFTYPPYFTLPCTSFLPLSFPSFPAPTSSPLSLLLYMPIIQLLCRTVPHYTQLYRLCYPRRRLWRNVRPTSQRRAVSPAAVFSAAPDCRWRPRLSRFFAPWYIFFTNIFVL